MRKHLTRLLSLVLALALLCGVLPGVFAAQSNEEKLIQALIKAVEPTNKILADRTYNDKPIAQLTFDPDALTADVMILDTEKRAIKMLEVPFLKELFSYKEIYSLQIGDDLIEYEMLNQFNIMLAVGHNTIGEGMELDEYYVWLRNLADTLTISAMDGHDVDITITGRTDHEDEDTEYSVTINLRIYNKYHKITWKFNNGEDDYVNPKLAYGASIAKPNPTPPEGMKFLRWDPEVPATMGTTDLEFSAVWIPVDHAAYTVRHFQMNTDLASYSLVETEQLSDKIGTSFLGSDKAREYEGFKLNAALGDGSRTKTVVEEGNMKIDLYYDRINVKITWEFYNGAKKLNRNVKYGLMPEPPAAPTPPDDGRDYVFVRWDREIVPATVPTTYKARYADDKMFVLTLDANGGEVASDTLYLYEGDAFSLIPTPTRTGYRFDGWFYENGDPVDLSTVVEDEGAATIVAHWTVRQYTIIFDSDGGTDVPPMTLDYGAVIVPPEDPVKEGCAFLGWSPLLPYTMPAKTFTVVARWHIHTPILTPAVDAGCTTPGNSAYYTCVECDRYYSDEKCTDEIEEDSWVIPALGHDFQKASVVTPSCIEEGYTLYVCSRCDAEEHRDTVPAAGHKWNDGEVTKPATATQDGVKTYTCTVCGATKTEVIPATGGSGCPHDHAHPEHKDATCTEDGYDRMVCDECELVLSETIIPALGHDYVNHAAQAATCTEVGWNAYKECSRCHDSTYVEIPAQGHNYVNHAAQAATCTEVGWAAYQTCTRCDYSTYKEIAALGHDIVIDPGTPATCTAPGITAGEHCTRCDYEIEQVGIPALGHDYVVTSAIAPTCTAGGSATYTCSRCGDSYTETLQKLGHDFKVTVVDPTCTERGYTYYECTRCDYTEKGGWTDPTGHQHAYPDHKDPTCTEAGYDKMICDDCGAVISETVIPALGHDLIVDAEKPATCTEPGLTEGSHCSRCDYKIAQQAVPALGHDWDEGKVTTQPTAAKDGVKTFTCLRCGATRTETVPATGELKNPFVDVGKNDYFYDPVLWAFNSGVTTGTDATHFGPNATCTRGQIVTFLWRALGEPEPTITKNPFVDVKTTDYYYKAVLWAFENGVTKGTDETHFAPGAFCKREHAVAFLYRAAGSPEYTNKTNPFKDVTSSAYYYDAVLWAVEKNITKGIDATHFGPSNSCQRCQIVTFLYRFMNP